MSINNTEHNSHNIQVLFKSELYFLLCFILFSPSQKMQTKLLQKQMMKQIRNSLETFMQGDTICGVV